jgi:hypothetical protein
MALHPDFAQEVQCTSIFRLTCWTSDYSWLTLSQVEAGRICQILTKRLLEAVIF